MRDRSRNETPKKHVSSQDDAKSFFFSNMIHLRHSWVLVLDLSAFANLILLLWSAGRTESQLNQIHRAKKYFFNRKYQSFCLRIVNDHCRYLQLGTHFTLDVSEDLFLSANSLRYLGAGNESCELVLLQFWGHLVKTRALQ